MNSDELPLSASQVRRHARAERFKTPKEFVRPYTARFPQADRAERRRAQIKRGFLKPESMGYTAPYWEKKDE